ncbi:MAG: methyltransferase domain-containing protein [Rhodobacteraceae bacterium]|jgi:16S rRNA (cytosine967-C5)-methyltransferase|nr:methyltransferase domain-containing protein [Paracoccaceae bacterium]
MAQADARGTGEGVAARRAAAAILDRILGEELSLSEVTGAAGPWAQLSDPADRARAQGLATDTLRHLGRADRLLKPHLRRAPPLAVSNILRLATVEMLERGAPAHGVVGAAVAVARAGRRTEHAAGMVNAVLRKVAGEGAAWAALPPQELPGWLRGRLLSAWGAKAVAAIERVHAMAPPMDLTPRDGDASALAARLGGIALLTGSVRLPPGAQVTALPGYAEGAWWVQDAAAALPARLHAPRPGEKIADLCAAPGGKTLQLAAAGAQVTAVDASADRMERLRQNLSRCRLEAETVVADVLDWAPPGEGFDAILLDAPCTATGTVRRHPELPFIRSGAAVKPLVALQAALIDRALGLLRPGGRLVFCTCSLLPEEGERQVAAALARHPGLAADTAVALPEGVDPAWCSAEGGLRLRPDVWADEGGMDGFYMARLVRPG